MLIRRLLLAPSSTLGGSLVVRDIGEVKGQEVDKKEAFALRIHGFEPENRGGQEPGPERRLSIITFAWSSFAVACPWKVHFDTKTGRGAPAGSRSRASPFGSPV